MTNEEKIKVVIDEYKRVFAWEYEAFKTQMAEKRLLANDDFSQIKGSQVEARAISEIPDTLYTLFLKNLDRESWDYFRSKKGQRWLVRTFLEFRVPKKV